MFELEADATIPAEYVLLRHYRGEPVDAEIERKIAVYLRRIQGAHGGWPLFHDGDFDMSASVKAYFALKMIGDSIDAAAHAARARGDPRAAAARRRATCSRACCWRSTTMIAWRAVPVMPVEIMLLPKWFPFHLDKISYWARTVIVPLLVLQALKPKAKNAKGVRIDELFLQDPKSVGPKSKAPHQKWSWFLLFRAIDIVLRAAEPLLPASARASARSTAAVAFVTERLNGEDGLGAIYPAMANSVMMFDLLGYPADHPDLVIARKSIEKLLVIKEDEAYCQPCVSPVWDTALTCHALLEVGGDEANQAGDARASTGSSRCRSRRAGRLEGGAAGRAARRLGVPIRQPALSGSRRHRRGGDGDGPRRRARRRATPTRFDTAMARGQEWVVGLQSRDGGWGAFDADNALPLPQQHPVRRSRRAARSADRRPHRPLRLDAGAARRQAGTIRRCSAASNGCARDQLAGRQLVRPLGHELHLRHLVGHVRAQRGRHRSGIAR